MAILYMLISKYSVSEIAKSRLLKNKGDHLGTDLWAGIVK